MPYVRYGTLHRESCPLHDPTTCQACENVYKLCEQQAPGARTMTRRIITGIPRSGKTSFSRLFDDTFHTDDLTTTHSWSGASSVIATMFDDPGSWTIEGVAAVRGLRKWLRAHTDGTPADVVYYHGAPRVALTPGQAAMAKATGTIWSSIRPELERRGVTIIEVRDDA